MRLGELREQTKTLGDDFEIVISADIGGDRPFNFSKLENISVDIGYSDKVIHLFGDLEEIKQLEKENAELKKKNLDTQDAVTMQIYTNKANKEIADRQLTKAKDLIKRLLNAFASNDFFEEEELDAMAEAEQFLNSEVEND